MAINTSGRLGWILLGVIVGFILAFALTMVLSEDDKGIWRRDLALSSQIFDFSSDQMVPNAEDVALMIDAIQIYQLLDGSLRHLAVEDLIESGGANLVFETQDQSKIGRFLSAATDLDTEPKDCKEVNGSGTFYVIAFDRDLLRTANFPIKICEFGGAKFIKVYVPTADGNWSIAYNKAFATFFMDIPYLENRLRRN